MTLEKVQKLATPAVDEKYKACYLKWWNSSPLLHQSLKIPASGVKAIKLDIWLSRIMFWAHVPFINIKKFFDFFWHKL
jgi:hypothetical protein